jgi:hypothetical protein
MRLEAILRMRDGPQKTGRLVAWVQGLFPRGQEPVLVGGAAVELYTCGAYVTGDLDFVGSVPSGVARALVAAGFERRGRHWLHEAGEVFLEFPGSALQAGEVAVRLSVGGCEVVVISAEDALADRLAAWKHWESAVDGVNAWLLFSAQRNALDRRRLRRRVAALGAEDAWAELVALARRVRTRDATNEEIERWAKRGP